MRTTGTSGASVPFVLYRGDGLVPHPFSSGLLLGREIPMDDCLRNAEVHVPAFSQRLYRLGGA